MKILALLWLLISMPALAQNADALYSAACGPKEASFVVDHVNGPSLTSPEPGKALVYIVQKESLGGIFTRIGLDGSWGGVVHDNSYIPLSVSPGEHHLCAATQDRKNPEAQLVHFRAEAGQVYFYLVRCGTPAGAGIILSFDAVDSDEARYLIASNKQSVAKPKP